MTNASGQAFPAIWRAGLLCGVLDITAAFATWGPKGVSPVRVLQGIAVGALGTNSYRGGWKTAALGLGFHFLIAFSAAAVFYTASRKLTFMTERPFLAGVSYGVAVYLVMYWVVVPFSRIQRGPVSLWPTVIAIITHMVCVGLPIALVVRRYST